MIDLNEKTFAIWGLSFKPGTDDIREAPSLDLIHFLVAQGAFVQVYDPAALENAAIELQGLSHVKFLISSEEALKGADALVLMTEWREFRNPDFDLIKGTLSKPIIFDGRNQYSKTEMQKQNIEYYPIGRP